jgi:hypothetical protein
MAELITTALVTLSSALLLGYWLRCAVLLLRGQYAPPEVLLSTTPSIRSTREAWKKTAA